MDGFITWVGIDAHKKTLVVAVLRPGKSEPDEFTVENNERSIRSLVRGLEKGARGQIRVCYEAGPCGYALQRRLNSDRIACDVIAPSLIPRKPGERIKTDRRDARKLAELYRAGVLTVVEPPTPEQEAIRDLCRCRETVRADLGRCRHRLVKMLVRRGFIFDATSRLWTQRHRAWLRSLEFENEIDRAVFTEYSLAIEQAERRLNAMESELEKAAQLPLYREHVAWLRCFHGIDTAIAMIFIAEIHGIERFDSPRKLAAYLGLVPTLYASGDRARRGGITKTGNAHIRRAILQACWHYRYPSRGVGAALRARREGQPERVLTIADEAQRRLTKRYRHLTDRGKNPNKAVIAVARELVGFFWAALRTNTNAASMPPPKKTSKTEVGQPRKARKEKRAA
jgi:transposase